MSFLAPLRGNRWCAGDDEEVPYPHHPCGVPLLWEQTTRRKRRLLWIPECGNVERRKVCEGKKKSALDSRQTHARVPHRGAGGHRCSGKNAELMVDEKSVRTSVLPTIMWYRPLPYRLKHTRSSSFGKRERKRKRKSSGSNAEGIMRKVVMGRRLPPLRRPIPSPKETPVAAGVAVRVVVGQTRWRRGTPCGYALGA